ncbi:hypothetical protein Goari_027025, partial [Gossypium aridum]|nr:hypothetical protein [Gossypium aridum]
KIPRPRKAFVHGVSSAIGEFVAYSSVISHIPLPIFTPDYWKPPEQLFAITRVEINCDNAMLLDIIRNGFASISNIVEVWLIHEWYNKDWKVKFRHVLRGSSKVADCLAKTAIEKLNQVVLFPVPPQYVIRLLEEDTQGSLYERTTVSNHS